MKVKRKKLAKFFEEKAQAAIEKYRATLSDQKVDLGELRSGLYLRKEEIDELRRQIRHSGVVEKGEAWREAHNAQCAALSGLRANVVDQGRAIETLRAQVKSLQVAATTEINAFTPNKQRLLEDAGAEIERRLRIEAELRARLAVVEQERNVARAANTNNPKCETCPLTGEKPYVKECPVHGYLA